MRFSKNDRERFEEKYIPEPNSGCWIWTAAINRYGYGHFMMRNPKRMERAHRISYQMAGRRIPRGKMLLHSCDMRCCVNPDHLSPGTHLENMRQCAARERYTMHNAILTKAQAAEIKNKIKMGITARAIAKQFGVHEATISDVKRGLTWKNA